MRSEAGERGAVSELSHVFVRIYVHLAKLTGETCLIPHLSLNVWSLFALSLQSKLAWRVKG